MVLILYCQCYVTVGIYSVVTIGTCRRILNETKVRCISTLSFDSFSNCLQLIFCCSTSADSSRISYAPCLIIKTCYVIPRISRGCTIGLFTHSYSTGFHSFCSSNSGNVKIFLQFKADLRIVTGLRDFRRNIVVAVYCYLRA